MVSHIKYIGSKDRIAKYLFNLFPTPNEVNYFYDLFGGSGVMAIMAFKKGYKNILYNEIDTKIVDLFTLPLEIDSLSKVFNIIDKYNLHSKQGFLRLREDYNTTKDKYLLYVLSLHSFSNLIRFNQKGDFNSPYGNRRLSLDTVKAFNRNKDVIKNIEVSNGDYIVDVKHSCFIYIDPPYYGANVPYALSWTNGDEERLHSFIDNLIAKKVYFGISNIDSNKKIVSWAKDRGLEIIYPKITYSLGRKKSTSKEIYITNYKTNLKKIQQPTLF
jgi:DNA adenine methylase Dam